MRYKLLIILASLILYWIIRYYVPYGYLALYPITLLVTIFHETGHAFFALVTGGSVHGIQINSDGSGYALVAGGLSLLVIPGGYIGSAIWGNAILYMALHQERYAPYVFYFIALVLLFSATVWYVSASSSLLLLVFAAFCYWLTRQSRQWQSSILLILGSTTLLYILMDFNGGPGSDLNRFSEMLPILPPFLWALVWLGIVSYITYLNSRIIWKRHQA